jgi:hypothetical protein
MFTRRPWWWVLGPALVPLAGAVWLHVSPPADRVTAANAARIKGGISRADAEAILGPPSHAIWQERPFDNHTSEVDLELAYWHGQEGSIVVRFWPNAFHRYGPQVPDPSLRRKVWRCGFFPRRRSCPVARLRAWLGW